VLMTNHVHILATPSVADGASRLMQDVGREYVRYVNRSYRRSGTLWEGRFKSSLVDSAESSWVQERSAGRQNPNNWIRPLYCRHKTVSCASRIARAQHEYSYQSQSNGDFYTKGNFL
jgi:REP element-mobilizing transposase RayT